MDEKTAALLREWNLSQYVEVFEDNEIGYDELIHMTQEVAINLFPGKLGPFVRFQRNLQFYLSHTPHRKSEPGALLLEVWFHSAPYSEHKSADFPMREQWSEHFKAEDADLDIESSLNESKPPVESVNEGTCHHHEGECNMVFRSMQKEVQTGDSTGFLVTHHGKSTTMCSCSSIQSCTPNQTSKPDYCDKDRNGSVTVKTLQIDGKSVVISHLNKTCIGRGILRLSKAKELKHTVRVKLCHEIIVAEVGLDGRNIISASRFLELALGIVAIFPRENAGRYFVPRKPVPGSRNAIQPKGILYDKYHNILKFLRHTGLRCSIRKGEEQRKIDDPPLTVSKDIAWLQKRFDVSPTLTHSKWQNTAEFRIAMLKKSGVTARRSKTDLNAIISYLNLYPCLAQPSGPSLLLLDFEHMYGGRYTSVIDHWPSVHAKFLKFMQKEKKDVGCGKTVTCLKFIPSLFNQPILISGSKKERQVWKPNGFESRQGFMLHVKTLGSLDTVLLTLKEKCELVNKCLQPIPALVGRSDDDIDFSFVIIGNHRYQMESPLLAFDTCFKMYHALHCYYPVQSSYSWLFVQQALYGLRTEWDFNAPSVTAKVNAFINITD